MRSRSVTGEPRVGVNVQLQVDYSFADTPIRQAWSWNRVDDCSVVQHMDLTTCYGTGCRVPGCNTSDEELLRHAYFQN